MGTLTTGRVPAMSHTSRLVVAGVACGVAGLLLMTGVAAAGDSAAVPGLGAATWTPPWDAGRSPSAAAVTLVLVVADGLAVVAVGCGLLAVRRVARGRAGRGDVAGAGNRTASGRPAGRIIAAAGLVAVAMLVCVPPLGSADHLSYAAYGRIAAAGDDPYVVKPAQWRGGTDPVAGAVQPPWQQTPSVYGPVGTAFQALAAVAGDGSLRLTVWAWQLIAGAAFLLTGWALDRLTRHDRAARWRAAVMWTLNPLLLGQLVLGAHIDVLAVAAAVGALAVAAASPLAGGVLLGVAVGIKAPYGLAALALVWGLRRAPRPVLLRHLGLGALGGLLVLVPAHLWSGPHTYDQLSQASRFVSLATPWRLVVNVVDPIWGRGSTRPIVSAVAWALAVVLAVLLARRLRSTPAGVPDGVPPGDGLDVAAAVRAFTVLTAAWILTVPYALPWYDAMVWAPLALMTATWLDVAMLARLGVLALAYVPGRVVGLTPRVEHLTLGFREHVAPWLMLALVASVVVWSLRTAPDRRQRSAETA